MATAAAGTDVPCAIPPEFDSEVGDAGVYVPRRWRGRRRGGRRFRRRLPPAAAVGPAIATDVADVVVGVVTIVAVVGRYRRPRSPRPLLLLPTARASRWQRPRLRRRLW